MSLSRTVGGSAAPCGRWLAQWWELVRWSAIRHGFLLPVFTVLQVLFAMAIVYGMALLIETVDDEAARYLSSGAWVLGIIAVGCVLAPQIVSTSKQEGMWAYQKTLPVGRAAILLADVFVWSVASLPGAAAGIVAAALRFRLAISMGPGMVLSILAVMVVAVGIGYAAAYWLSPNAVGLVTQVIMMGGLLFSPILYPETRLPRSVAIVHHWLPFGPMAELVRASAFDAYQVEPRAVAVLLGWAVAAYALAYAALRRRD